MWASRTIVGIFLLTALMKAGANRWRPDHRCGGSYQTYIDDHTRITAECNPDAGNPCCSSEHWCGDSFYHCQCMGCVDYRVVHKIPQQVQDSDVMWRPDHRCGRMFTVAAPGESRRRVAGQCNPREGNPCCSSAAWCGDSWAHCHCSDCVDFRKRLPSPSTTTLGPISGCRSPYQEVSDKCLLYSTEPQTWDTADQFCAGNDGRLITFGSLDHLMKFVDNLTLLEISEESNPNLDAPYWVGVSTVGREVQEGQHFEWRWVVGDRGQQDATALKSSSGEQQCSFLVPRTASTISHDGDCSALKLPLCEHSTY